MEKTNDYKVIDGKLYKDIGKEKRGLIGSRWEYVREATKEDLQNNFIKDEDKQTTK